MRAAWPSSESCSGLNELADISPQVPSSDRIFWKMATSTMNGSSRTAAENCPAEVREILHAAACGTELTFEQGLVLATAEGSSLEALVAVADRLRRETVGDAITYVVNRNINFTNICFVGCSFCGFCRGPGRADAYSLS